MPLLVARTAGIPLAAVEAASPVAGSISSAQKVLAEFGVEIDAFNSDRPVGTLTW